MIQKSINLFVVLVVLSFAGLANASILTFEDVFENPLETYGGVQWHWFGRYETGGAITKGTVSGNAGAYSLVAGVYVDALALPGQRLNFQGAYFTGNFVDDYEIQVDGFLGGEVVYSTTIFADNTTPTWFEFNYTNVDRVGFLGKDSGPFLMDDFTFTSEAVPEPGALILLGAGFAGLVALRRIV